MSSTCFDDALKFWDIISRCGDFDGKEGGNSRKRKKYQANFTYRLIRNDNFFPPKFYNESCNSHFLYTLWFFLRIPTSQCTRLTKKKTIKRHRQNKKRRKMCIWKGEHKWEKKSDFRLINIIFDRKAASATVAAKGIRWTF